MIYVRCTCVWSDFLYKRLCHYDPELAGLPCMMYVPCCNNLRKWKHRLWEQICAYTKVCFYFPSQDDSEQQYSIFFLVKSHRCTREIPEPRPRTCTILNTAWGSNRGSWGFSRNQNTHGLPVAYVTCSYCGLSRKINTSHCITHKDCARVCFVFLVFFGRQKLEDPQFDPHGWQRNYTGWHTSLGPPLYICR